MVSFESIKKVYFTSFDIDFKFVPNLSLAWEVDHPLPHSRIDNRGNHQTRPNQKLCFDSLVIVNSFVKGKLEVKRPEERSLPFFADQNGVHISQQSVSCFQADSTCH